ncbi:MAG: hypothetical protein ACHQ7M_17825 [Chloroflexota bacterium]
MAQPEYILNFHWKRPVRIFQASTLRAEHPEGKLKYQTFGGMRIAHSTGTGRIDRRKLDITSSQVKSYVFRVPASAEGSSPCCAGYERRKLPRWTTSTARSRLQALLPEASGSGGGLTVS